jgi:hypothetical protein
MFWTVDSTTWVQLDHQNGNRDQIFVYISDTLCFTPEVLHLSTTHPLDMSTHSTMLSLAMTSQWYHIWKQEQSHNIGQIYYNPLQNWQVRALNLAQAGLGSTGLDNTDLQFMDNPVVDPFAIVTDHHNSSITKNGYLDQETNNITYQKQPSTTMVLPQTIVAVSKGDTLTLGSKRSLITADDSVLPASQAATITSQDRDTTTATISEPSMAQSVDELKPPPCLNLHELGLC